MHPPLPDNCQRHPTDDNDAAEDTEDIGKDEREPERGGHTAHAVYAAPGAYGTPRAVLHGKNTTEAEARQQPHQQDAQSLRRHDVAGDIALFPEQPPDMPRQMVQPFRGGGGLPYRFRFRVRAFRFLLAQQQGIGGNTQYRRQRNDPLCVGGGFARLP